MWRDFSICSILHKILSARDACRCILFNHIIITILCNMKYTSSPSSENRIEYRLCTEIKLSKILAGLQHSISLPLVFRLEHNNIFNANVLNSSGRSLTVVASNVDWRRLYISDHVLNRHTLTCLIQNWLRRLNEYEICRWSRTIVSGQGWGAHNIRQEKLKLSWS